MKDYFELGSSPSGEDCVQVELGKDYLPEMKKELYRYNELLCKIFPVPEYIDCYFGIKWFSHDFGKYGEVVVYYNDEIDEEVEFALFVESNLPEKWTDDKMLEFVYSPRIPKCDQCDSLNIQGVYCHEKGCPNWNKEYNFEEKNGLN